jgi:hypothetical protein
MSGAAGAARLRAALAVSLLLSSAIPARAAGWFESGDYRLRTDLLVLNDAGVIRVPVNHWPIAQATLEFALADANEHFATNAAVSMALARTRARLAAARAADGSLRAEVTLAAGEPGLLRDFDTPAREDAELGGRLAYGNARFSVALRATAVNDPADDQQLRLDGSHATFAWGNWLLSANTLDRWWGPGHEGSLILSNNARPMPTVMVERAEARAFESRWLSWLGPWRFTLGISQMEDERADIDSPLFMAWRVVVMPWHDMEIGFSRTAQFCGETLPCSASSFWDMLIGNDNPGFDATPESEPGNQMAGFDLRWNSPIGNLPYAFYGQYIGEDESGYLPVKYLGQLGLEIWKPLTDGGVVQAFAEYTNTTCSALSSGGPYYDCAYNQGQFNVEGYRYRGRVIGHTTDSDAESYALGAVYVSARGATWTATLRGSRLNHDGVDPRNTVAPAPADYHALELGWQGALLGGSLAVEVGAESLAPEGLDRDIEPFGFLSWRRELAP